MRAVRIAGEPFDADWVETPVEHEDPSYPECPMCEQETDKHGYCSDCEEYASEMERQFAEVKPFDQKMKDYPTLMKAFEPLSELKRTGTGAWFA